MVLTLISLWIMNAIDALGTSYFVSVKQVGYEANPVMAWIIGLGWPVFFAVKLAIMSATTVGIYHLRDKLTKPFKIAIGFVFAMYAFICIWHGVAFVLVQKGAL